MMSYVEASSAPLRKTGQIKLHGPEAFAGMRKAGRLVAECLDCSWRPRSSPGSRPTGSTGWCSSSPWTMARGPRR